MQVDLWTTVGLCNRWIFQVYVYFLREYSGQSGKRGKKNKRKKEKRANAFLGPSGRLFKELGERLVDLERKGLLIVMKRTRSLSLSPIHIVGVRAMKSPCASFVMRQ